MAGIHLPDIGKLGIRIATGIRDKKKVAPSNMAENARFQALSTRLDSEKHERSRVLKKEERRMKRKKHGIDKRRLDIQKSKRQDLNNNVDTNDGKRFLPLISLPKTAISYDRGDELLSDDRKDFDQYSGGPSSAIFPIQDELSRLLESASDQRRVSREKRKIILPSIDTDPGEDNVKHRKTAPSKKSLKKNNLTNKGNNILERKHVESSAQSNAAEVIPNPLKETINFTINHEVYNELAVDAGASSPGACSPTRKKEVANEEETHVQIINSTELSIEESNYSANPFNYLLLEEQRRSKALHQNLEDAFRAIKTCRYIRTPSRREKETDFDE